MDSAEEDSSDSVDITTLPADASTTLEQFNWVSSWLSKNGLTKTLDKLLEEYDSKLSTVMTTALPVLDAPTPISNVKHNLTGIHGCSVLSVRFHPTRPWLLSSDTAKNLILSSSEDGKILSSVRSNNPFRGCVIAIDINPTFPELVVIGTMDDSHALLKICESEDGSLSISTLKIWKVHTKFVVRTKWSPAGSMFATASHDNSIGIYQLEDDHSSAKMLHTIHFQGQVESIAWTKDSKYLVAAIRGDSNLHYIEIHEWKTTLASVNALGDTHVSFNVLELTVSPDGKQVVASTDKSRTIVFKTGTPVQLHNIYGIDNDGFSQPRAAFDSKGLLYLTAQDNKIHVFDKDREIAVLSGHGGLVRDLVCHPTEDVLVSCSYDKTIRLWTREKLSE